MVDFSYNKLRDIQREERSSAALTKIPDDFYSQIDALVGKTRESASSSRSITEIKEYENMLKIVRDIFGMREQKIAFRALRSRAGSHDSSGMTKDEHELYDRFLSLVDWNRKRIDSVFGEGEMTVVKPEKSEGTFKRVRFLKDLPAYKGSDEATYGPFKLGEERAVPFSEADWLVKGKMADLLP